MGSPPAGSRTAAATDARRRATQDALGRVRDAIRQIRREKAQLPVAAVARRALLTELKLEFQQFIG